MAGRPNTKSSLCIVPLSIVRVRVGVRVRVRAVVRVRVVVRAVVRVMVRAMVWAKFGLWFRRHRG